MGLPGPGLWLALPMGCSAPSPSACLRASTGLPVQCPCVRLTAHFAPPRPAVPPRSQGKHTLALLYLSQVSTHRQGRAYLAVALVPKDGSENCVPLGLSCGCRRRSAVRRHFKPACTRSPLLCLHRRWPAWPGPRTASPSPQRQSSLPSRSKPRKGEVAGRCVPHGLHDIASQRLTWGHHAATQLTVCTTPFQEGNATLPATPFRAGALRS
jgi:hypothetical protein